MMVLPMRRVVPNSSRFFEMLPKSVPALPLLVISVPPRLAASLRVHRERRQQLEATDAKTEYEPNSGHRAANGVASRRT